ncbi:MULTISPECIES: phage tail tape measure protein [Helcococcus]|uniref:Phage tail tape measure protein n=1 Tax=Helcococcus bovis TaxID=3153252 RepID=A0ABW9F4Y2_9FIRM
MAGKIKGITIEIDGNTSKLSDKLKDVESKSKDTNKSLKDIEKSLKFHPGNTELVSQQQRKLKEAIENTKEKLNILKDADVKAKEQLANGKLGQDAYDELQREIIATEGALSSYNTRLDKSQKEQESLKTNTEALKDKLEESGKTTDDLADLMGDKFVDSLEKGEGSSKEVKKAIDKLSESMDEGSNEVEGMIQSFTEFNSVIEVFSKVKDAAVAVFSKISEAWKEIDDGLDTIVSKTGASGEALDSMNNEFKDIYSSMAVDAKSVGDAIGEVNTQFGFQGDELENASKILLKYSEINGVDVTNSTQLAKKAMDQFNLSNKDLSMVLDSVTKAGQDTGVSVDSLFDKVTAGAPTLTNLGLSFEESVVLLSRFEQGGLDSSKMLGFMTKAQAVAAKDGKSLTTVLEEFSNKAKTSTDKTKLLEEANRLFGTKGGAVMLKAIQEGKLGLEDLSKVVENSAGSVSSTYENMQDPADKFTIAQNNLKLALAEVGTTIQESLAPAINFVVDIIQKLVEWFTSLDENTKTIIVTVTGLVAVITSIILVVGLISSALTTLGPIIASVKAAFIGFGTSLSSLFTFVAANPIVLIIAAIVAAIVLIIKNWDAVKEKTIEVWNSIVEFLNPIISGIKDFIINVFNGIKDVITSIFNGIKIIITSVFEGIKTGITIYINAIKTIITSVFNIIKTIVTSIWNGIKLVITSVLEGIKIGVTAYVNTIKNVITSVFNIVKSIVSNIWNSIKSIITIVLEGIKTGVTTAINSVKNIITNVFNGIKRTVSTIWNGIKTAITTPITAAKDAVKRIIDAIKGLFNFKFKWPKIPKPHFRLQGSLNPIRWVKEGLPKLNIDWYQKGGIFDKPSIIGVGERGSEAVVPTNKLDKFFDDALNRVNISREKTNAEGIIINIEKLEVRKESDIEKIALELYKLTKRNERGLSGV